MPLVHELREVSVGDDEEEQMQEPLVDPEFKKVLERLPEWLPPCGGAIDENGKHHWMLE
ncbi:MAG: hypothetical protein HYT50_00040 [Candidatus Wildermuthbacteria bacterium]|nr:hypothetical protein [Candidatus Wildermuthbacteria bacterium]